MRVVTKPWGREEIWAESDKYVGKTLFINKGHRLSLQYHRKKTETIRVLEGSLDLVLQDPGGDLVTERLEPGDSYHIDPWKVHRFAARDTDVVLVEVSTPELDDVVRVNDDYSRDSQVKG